MHRKEEDMTPLTRPLNLIVFLVSEIVDGRCAGHARLGKVRGHSCFPPVWWRVQAVGHSAGTYSEPVSFILGRTDQVGIFFDDHLICFFSSILCLARFHKLEILLARLFLDMASVYFEVHDQ